MELDSPRWIQLKAHFGNAGVDGELPAVPKLLRAWHESAGTYREEYAYEPLSESYLHQLTILDVAYAVVPHLASRLSELDPDRRQLVLENLAVVDKIETTPRSEVESMIDELSRKFTGKMRDHLVQATRDRHPELPPDLAPTYNAAIKTARELAGESWGDYLSEQTGAHHHRRHLRFLRDSGVEDTDIVAALEALTQEPEMPIYLGSEDQIVALESIGWRDRVPAASGPEHDELRLNALRSLAFYQTTCTNVLALLRADL